MPYLKKLHLCDCNFLDFAQENVTLDLKDYPNLETLIYDCSPVDFESQNEEFGVRQTEGMVEEEFLYFKISTQIVGDLYCKFI